MLKSSDPEIQCVFDFALSFAGAIKNYSLYPQHHAIARKHLLNVSRTLSRFFSNYARLRLDVDKLTLLYDGDIVYRGEARENDIAYLLGRDGVQYLEFVKGVELWELRSLLRLINRNKSLDEENEGDIVTALWEQDYPHIQYKAVDILSLDAPALNFGSFRVAPEHHQTRPGASTDGKQPFSEASEAGAGEYPDEDDLLSDVEDLDEYPQVDAPPVSIAITAKDHNLWALSPLERYELEKMVAVENERDDTDDIIDILLILLILQNNEEDFVHGLEFLQDRFIRSLKIHRFDAALKVLENLKRIRKSFIGKKDWGLPLVDDFFVSVSQPESLRDVERLLLDLDEAPDSGQIKCLWSILRRLTPEILSTIGPLAGAVPSIQIRQSLAEIILHHSRHDPQAFADTVHLLDEELCCKFVPVAEQMNARDGNSILNKMALHTSPLVRKTAFDLLVNRGKVDPLELFSLINDADEAIRENILNLVKRKRNAQVEDRLLAYLKSGENIFNNREHLLACYEALGHCGSARSIPFLQGVLMGGGWSGLVSRISQAHKQGAANALHFLHLDEADAILREGASGMLPDVRLACRKAIGK